MNIAVKPQPLKTTKEPRAFLEHGEPAGGMVLHDLEVEILGGIFPNVSADINIHKDSDGLGYAVVAMIAIDGLWQTIRRCTKTDIGMFWGAGCHDMATERDIAARIARELEQNPAHGLDEHAHERLGK